MEDDFVVLKHDKMLLGKEKEENEKKINGLMEAMRPLEIRIETQKTQMGQMSRQLEVRR